jgi:salicylate hydroxylase
MTQPQPQPHNRIRVAIAGGGIAGATLFYALRQHRHLDVHIFEAAPNFREAGASVGIHYNAFKALALISPDAVACLEAAGAFQLDGFTASMAVGDDQGRNIALVGQEGGTCVEHVVRSVSRAAMLRVLLADAPPQQMHTSKQLEGFETRPDGSLELLLYVYRVFNIHIYIYIYITSPLHTSLIPSQRGQSNS